MKVTKSIQDSTLTVQLEGKLDTNTTPLAEQEIMEDVDKADTIIIDMEKLKYISSAGLRLLLILHKKMATRGGLIIININEPIREILDFTGFSEILEIK
ncbi:MAG: STAS domain-containing protein [Clostridia bacterium]|nr:STAS domain-containing protein [Clostridia bacterium]